MVVQQNKRMATAKSNHTLICLERRVWYVVVAPLVYKSKIMEVKK